MKMGRFDESITMYQKALASIRTSSRPTSASATIICPWAIPIRRGRRSRKLRRSRATPASGARRVSGPRRPTCTRARPTRRSRRCRPTLALAEAEHDGGSMSGDLNLMGDVLREAGRLDDALAKYASRWRRSSDGAGAGGSEGGDAAQPRSSSRAGVAVAKHDLATAKAKAAEYARQVAVKNVRFEVRQQHELAGLIALAEKRAAAAAQEFKANQQDPRILYLTSLALKQAGDAAGAPAMAAKAANFNGLSFSYGYVKRKAGKPSGTADRSGARGAE